MTWLVVALAVAAVVCVAALVALRAAHAARRRPVSPDLCETCGRPATHELAAITFERDGGSACIACYCRRHAPAGAVKVR